MKLLTIARDLAAIAALAALAWLLVALRADVRASAADLAASQAQLRATLLDVSRFAQDATGVTAELRRTLKVSQASSVAVAANSAQATKETAAAVASLNALVAHTDASLNADCVTPAPPPCLDKLQGPGCPPIPAAVFTRVPVGGKAAVPSCGLIPALAAAVARQNAGLSDVEAKTGAALDRLAATEGELGPVLANATTAAANLARVTADPAIPATLNNLAAASQGMAQTSANAAAASRDLAEAVHRETRPASFAVKVGGFVVKEAATAGSIIAGFIK